MEAAPGSGEARSEWVFSKPFLIYLRHKERGVGCLPSEHEEELLPSKGDGALAQAAQRGCGVSFSGDIQDPPGRGAVQPALGDPAWAGGWAG